MRARLTRALAPWLTRGVRPDPSEQVAEGTGLSAESWRELALTYTDLPADPGRGAAQARASMGRLSSRALSSGRWNLKLEGEPPGPGPCVYATAHIGSLQTLRYALRSRGTPAATVLGPHNLERKRYAEQDGLFARSHPHDFPHAFPASAVHRLRGALKRGSLVVAADLPPDEGVRVPLLGAWALVDPRPFRLARTARVPCRPAFVTVPEGRWTLTLGPPLPNDEQQACEEFGRAFGRVAGRSPFDLDGVVYAHIAERIR